ncbi:hypothetical protein C6P40_002862 [Pichia californica]|uniref:Uncharacterized protein n=1 Tax=Pichia californica TaxID=460514 RepID=A0A9P6WJW7_9ASCO|nr:hypothetical protein C6P42_002633 [[Candida] californica]KAG0687113.1 hypothetical protein C6P40_002862 [[Candida] californica]
MTLTEDIKEIETLIDQDKLEEAKIKVDKLCDGNSKPPAPILLLKSKILLRLKNFDESIDAAAMASFQGNEVNNKKWISEGAKLMAFGFYRKGEFPAAAQYIYLADNYSDNKDTEIKLFKDMINRKLGINHRDDKFEENLESLKELYTEENFKNDTIKETIIKNDNDDKNNKIKLNSEPVKQNLRTDWFDSGKIVEISIYIKKIIPETVESNIKFNLINFKFKDSNNFEYEYKIDKLFADIDELNSSFKVFGTKLQILLVKKELKTWTKLENIDNIDNNNNNIIECKIPKDEESSGIVYPSITKKDWSKIKFDDIDDDDGNNEEESQDPDGFFKKLYENAGDDAKRAMMKSFIESNGTSLSTDWNDVGSREVKPYTDEKDN